ncbi:MAG: CHAD domain-containing protein [Anaerolineales bacterium]|nr:CHAD domain-containing protein [Anaerolineales bacterium]
MMNLSEIARGVFQTQLQAMQMHLEGCIKGSDPIHLHDLRVANRRTRAALIEFKELLPEDIFQNYQQDFRWIHQVTGEVRDLDVVLSYYQILRKEIPKSWRPHLKPLHVLLNKKRMIAQEELSGILQSDRVIEILESWSDSLEKGITTGNSLSLEDAREYGSLRIVKRYSKLQKRGQDLSKKAPAEDYHDFRIMVKKLRYLMEFFRPSMDQEEFDKIRGNLKAVQDTYGVFQDTEIQLLNLRELSGEIFELDASVDTMLALGQVLGVLEKRLSQAKKKCLKQAYWLISDASVRSFQSCFQYPID